MKAGEIILPNLFLLIFLFSTISFAQSNGDSLPGSKKSLIQEEDLLKTIENLKNKNYDDAIIGLGELDKALDQFVEQENLECISEVPYTYLNDEGIRVSAKKKLNYKEKKVCLKKVIEFRITFLKHKLGLRKILLKKLYEKEQKDLQDSFELSERNLLEALKKFK